MPRLPAAGRPLLARPRPRRPARRAAPRAHRTGARMSLSIADPVPTFTLPDARGGEAGLAGGAPAVVVFTCNHCPYALAWHDRIVDVARDVEIPALIINSHPRRRYPRQPMEANAP